LWILNLFLFLKNIFTLPEQPNSIPYVTSYYKKTWGFCISENQKKRLPKGNYKIVIDNIKRALDLCSPLRNLPIEKYDSWKEIILQFDVGKN
jgi:aminopeptidase-like protein